MNDVSLLCRRLGYQFKNNLLLEQALTHRSSGALNNERLEFLGDAVVNLVITDLLHDAFPDCPEGRMSRMRAALVKEDTLAKVAIQLELGEVIQLGRGEMRSGGHRRKSILADAFEAVLGALYLDGGFLEAKRVIQALFADRLNHDLLEENIIDHKTHLQESLQALKKPLPVYTLMEVTGKVHDQVFHVVCSVSGIDIVGKGQGTTRRKAEQAAAYQLLAQMKQVR